MKRRIAGSVWLAAALGLTGTGEGRADIAPSPLISGGASASPRLAQDAPCPVEMITEEVDLHPSPTLNRVAARFVLKNTGTADATFEVGFPSYFETSLQDFKVEVDGKSQAATMKKDKTQGPKSRFTYWMCWPMSFPRGAERVVVVRYAVATERVFSALHIDKLPPDLKDPLWNRTSGYVLRTGAGWGGKIGKATIRLHYGEGCRKDLMVSMLPQEGWVYDASANADVLTLTDFEPQGDWFYPGEDSSDIEYVFRGVDSKTECEILLKAMAGKRIDPWAMQYTLKMVEKANGLGLSDTDRSALATRILEQMLPPVGPDGYDHEISPGALAILEKAHARLCAQYTGAGDTARAEALAAAWGRLQERIATDNTAFLAAKKKAE